MFGPDSPLIGDAIAKTILAGIPGSSSGSRPRRQAPGPASSRRPRWRATGAVDVAAAQPALRRRMTSRPASAAPIKAVVAGSGTAVTETASSDRKPTGSKKSKLSVMLSAVV